MNAFEASEAVARANAQAALAGGVTVAGDASVLASVFSVLQPGDPDFAIVTP